MKKNMFHAISLVAILTLIAKGLGMVRDILQARAFGTDAEIDLFTNANNSTIYLFTTAAYALCLAAVPIISQKKAKDRALAEKTANNLIGVSILVSIPVVVLIILAASFRLLGNETGESGYSLSWYISVMALTLPLIILIYLLLAYFQSLGHYSLQGSLSFLFNLVLCAVLLIMGQRMSVPAFAVLMSAAWLLQLVMVVPFALKEGYRFRPTFDFSSSEIRTYLRTALVTAFTTAAFLFCYMIDTRQATGLGAGVASSFYYADKLFTPLTTTLIYSIGAVVFPKWSESYTKEQPDRYCANVGIVVQNTVLLLMPLAVICSVFGEPLVRILFEGGAFTGESTGLTGSVFSCYAWGMIGFALLDLLSKAFYATGRTGVPLVVNAGVILLNFLFNTLALKLIETPSSIAAVTAVVMTLGGIVLVLVFFKGRLRKTFSAKKLLAGTLISVLLYYGMQFACNYLINDAESKMFLLLKCLGVAAAALLVYLMIMGRFIVKRNKN